MPALDLWREHGISNATAYQWRAKLSGMYVSLMARMKELEDENRRLKKLYVDGQVRAFIVEETLAKNSPAISPVVGDQGRSRPTPRALQSGMCGVQHQRDLLPL